MFYINGFKKILIKDRIEMLKVHEKIYVTEQKEKNKQQQQLKTWREELEFEFKAHPNAIALIASIIIMTSLHIVLYYILHCIALAYHNQKTRKKQNFK